MQRNVVDDAHDAGESGYRGGNYSPLCGVGTLVQSLQRPNTVRQNLPYSISRSNFRHEPKA